MATLEAIKYTRGSLELLDQTRLPLEFVYERVVSCEQCFEAIKQMRVRGAPAIGVAAALAVAVEAVAPQHAALAGPAAVAWVAERTELLEKARPTAVNLRFACEALRAAVAEGGLARVVAVAEELLRADGEANRAIGDCGRDHIFSLFSTALQRTGARLRMLTHCNTGALATARYGTALGVARSLHAAGRLERVFCTEARPWCQGARLSTFEMAYEHIPVTLLIDSAAASLLRSGQVDFVCTGADRVCRNGDTANKIGTYTHALAAAAHHIPFFIAAPLSSFDAHAHTGADVPIEQRPAHEITVFPGETRPHVAAGVEVFNPSFDITPGTLVSAFFTDHGVILPPFETTIPQFLAQHQSKWS